jgi:2-methylaconitate cis-trans-isomerase PrpF
VDVSNPGVFVRARDLMEGPFRNCTTPAAVEADEGFQSLLEEVRQAGAERMRLDPKVQSVPKIVMVFDAEEGAKSKADGVDIRCLAMSMGQAHKAVPLTLALCLGAAAGIEGTIPYQLRSDEREQMQEKGKEKARSPTVVIGHPSGRVEIGATVEDGEVVSAELHRTARVLMKGEVFH